MAGWGNVVKCCVCNEYKQKTTSTWTKNGHVCKECNPKKL